MQFFTHSERIKSDLELAFEDPKNWSQHVILREWVSIPLWCEFRGFIFQNKLTALCQYYHHVFFPQIIEKKAEILERINKFLQEVSPLLPKVLRKENGNVECSAVADFAVDLENNKMYIIELNPFRDYEGNGTSACMFDWKKDNDLLFGKIPFEFRVEEKKKEDLIHSTVKSVEWRELFAAVDKELEQK